MSILIGFGTMLCYQLILTNYKLSQFVFFAPRTDFFSANREGLLSIVGYFSMQLIGIGLGRLLYYEMLDPVHFKILKAGKLIEDKDSKPKQKDVTKRERSLIFKLIACEVLLCIAYVSSKRVFGEPSRRLCNLPYVLY